MAKKHQKKLVKVMKLVDIMRSALAVFKTSISKASNDRRVDEQEFTMLQTFHLGVLYKLVNIDHEIEAKTRTHLKNIYWMRSTTERRP